jgi:hypothetical protein
MQFLYMGFSQEANIRSYRFHGIPPKEKGISPPKAAKYALQTDLSLLPQHRISIQEGPELCLRILMEALGGGVTVDGFSEYSVTVADMSAYYVAKHGTGEAKVTRRKARPPFKPSASSQLRWPQTR